MTRTTFAALAALVLLGTPAVTAGQTPLVQPQGQGGPNFIIQPQGPGSPTVIFQPQVDADQVREQLREILRQYPPNVGEVLQRDPSLLTREDYLTPYPGLTQFLQQHPEIVRNPGFYFGGFNYYYQERREPLPVELEALGAMLGGLAGFAVGIGFLTLVIYVVRALIHHRRWIRVSRTQAEVHTKLLDRMTTNEELLAYIQSPAGRRYLEASPSPVEADGPRWSAPVGPILFAMMAGIVLATLGVGFQVAVQSVASEARDAFAVVGVIILALGVGFILSSVMAYLVSARLGLLGQRPATAPGSDHA